MARSMHDAFETDSRFAGVICRRDSRGNLAQVRGMVATLLCAAGCSEPRIIAVPPPAERKATPVVVASAEPVASTAPSATAPPPIATEPPPVAPPPPAPKGCVPHGPDARVAGLRWSRDRASLAECVTGGTEPVCVSFDLASGAVSSIAAPENLLADGLPSAMDSPPESLINDVMDQLGDKDVKVCKKPGRCRTVMKLKNVLHARASQDGTMVVSIGEHEIETWDVASRRRLARISPRPDKDGPRALSYMLVGFIGHTVLLNYMPCAAACASGELYDARGGSFIAEVPGNTTELVPLHVAGEVWAFGENNETSGVTGGDLVFQDVASGKVDRIAPWGASASRADAPAVYRLLARGADLIVVGDRDLAGTLYRVDPKRNAEKLTATLCP